MNHLGRGNRYLVNPKKESTITMAINVADKVMKSTNTAADDIDMVVFVSDTPEYTYPSNVWFIRLIFYSKSPQKYCTPEVRFKNLTSGVSLLW